MSYITDIVNQFIHTEVLSYCYIKFKVANSEISLFSIFNGLPIRYQE